MKITATSVYGGPNIYALFPMIRYTLDLGALVEATEGFSGAEIEQAVIASLYRSLHRKTALDTAILLEEIRETVPLSHSRREDVARLRASAEGRFVAAN